VYLHHTLILCYADKVIPKQLFEVPIQAVVNGKIVARETLSATRADVTAGLYGGISTKDIALLGTHYNIQGITNVS
jgi:translation elongation factor EF-4